MLIFWQSFGLIAVAEMGDKSQLVALAFATRFRARTVLLAVAVATLIVHLGSVFLGKAIDTLLPGTWVTAIAGVAFIGFGLWTLRGDTLDENPAAKPARWGAFLTVAVTFFISELGDKTMLATVTLATGGASLIGVWLGSTLGMVTADALSIGVGMLLGKRLPANGVRYGAAVIFVVTGLITLASLFR